LLYFICFSGSVLASSSGIPTPKILFWRGMKARFVRDGRLTILSEAQPGNLHRLNKQALIQLNCSGVGRVPHYKTP
jgi:hypothetical protein